MMYQEVSVLIRQVREAEVILEVDVEEYASWRGGEPHTAELLMEYLEADVDHIDLAVALGKVPEGEWEIVSNTVDGLWT